jgi:hypothetical protein
MALERFAGASGGSVAIRLPKPWFSIILHTPQDITFYSHNVLFMSLLTSSAYTSFDYLCASHVCILLLLLYREFPMHLQEREQH